MEFRDPYEAGALVGDPKSAPPEEKPKGPPWLPPVLCVAGILVIPWSWWNLYHFEETGFLAQVASVFLAFVVPPIAALATIIGWFVYTGKTTARQIIVSATLLALMGSLWIISYRRWHPDPELSGRGWQMELGFRHRVRATIDLAELVRWADAELVAVSDPRKLSLDRSGLSLRVEDLPATVRSTRVRRVLVRPALLDEPAYVQMEFGGGFLHYGIIIQARGAKAPPREGTQTFRWAERVWSYYI